MKQRCLNPKHPKFHRYGGRGITVCARWVVSFESFLADMGERPTPASDYSIERKNNDGNYEPDNCVWATRKTQQRNRSANKRVEYLGKEMTLFEAVELSKTAVPYETIYFRLRQGWDLILAMTKPLGHTGRPRELTRKRERVGA